MASRGSAASTSYQEALKGLEARGFGIKPGLERMQDLVELLDNPQLTYPTIHIAGTNGKTSIARMTGAILGAHGLKTGVYTSPHLQSIRERFALFGIAEAAPEQDEQGGEYEPEEPEDIATASLAGDMISKGEFGALLEYLSPFVGLVEERRGESVTYFELTTLAAFEWMSEKTVAAGVFEAGLGGRWDATNLIESSVAVLGEIGVDHSQFLGDTPLANAQEKAGIIKKGSLVISAGQSEEVAALIKARVAEQQAKLAVLGEDFSITSDASALGGRLVSVETPLGVYEDLILPLYGAHQSRNLTLAIAAAEAFRDAPLDEDSLRAAIATLRIPGRLEVMSRRPLVILDGAHNPSGAAALRPAITEAFGDKPVSMVVSIFKDKDAAGVLKHLAALAERIIFTRSSSPRAADPKELANLNGREDEVIEPLPEAIEAAIAGAPEDGIVLITGSLFAVGEARDHLVDPIP
ncbi:MAG: bifunctional folylpolyglutamate synthase/dihydrofolate synthase [Actinomycetota bacterium]